MKVIQYTPQAMSVSFSNAVAFKEGKVKGPCLRFQRSLHGQNRSSQQSKEIWQKH